MNDRALASIPSPECNDFLLAVIDEAPNGTQLTVLSALAQANVDPWEEAARLSAMSKVTAEKALVSVFDKVPGRNWSPSEEATIAARLVELLPPRGGGMETATMTAGASRYIACLVGLDRLCDSSVHPVSIPSSGCNRGLKYLGTVQSNSCVEERQR